MLRWFIVLLLLAPRGAGSTEWRVLTHSLGDQVTKDGAQLVGRPHAGKRAFFVELVRQTAGIQTAGDAKDLPICTLIGNVNDQRLSALGFTAIIRAYSYSECFRQLAAGRIVLVATSDADVSAKLREAGLDATALRPTPVVLGDTQGYIAISKDTAPDQAARWSGALDTLKRDGEYQRLLVEYAR
jgi:ABC-type amino acid transport substrate-binding protein